MLVPQKNISKHFVFISFTEEHSKSYCDTQIKQVYNQQYDTGQEKAGYLIERVAQKRWVITRETSSEYSSLLGHQAKYF